MKISAVIYSLLAGTLCISAAAQEMPGRRHDAPAIERTVLAPADVSIIDVASADKRAAPAQEKSGRLRVGTVRDVMPQKRAQAWSADAQGRYVMRTAVRSREAKGIRARLDISRIAPGMEIRVAADFGSIAEVMPLDAQAAGEIWTPYTEGDTQFIEVWSRSDPRGVQVRLTGAVQFDISLLSLQAGKAASGACNPDVSCTSNDAALDAALAERKHSVAMISFNSGGGSFACTGTLINSDRFPVPYFLTANHCISTQAEASSLTTFWFREATSCGASTFNPGVQVSGGAQLAFTSYNVDSTLLQLNNSPPPGAVYSGWNAAALTSGDSIVSISHPRTDPQKFALGNYSRLVRTFDYAQDFYGIQFTRGVIEPGSSGSGLFTLAGGSLQLRGILDGSTTSNGGLSCSNLNDLGIYGRFEIFYPQIRNILATGVSLADDHGNLPATATDLPLGGQLNGRIDYPGDIDVFRITITQPGTLSVYSTGGNDLVGALLNSEGSGLASNDDAQTRDNEFGISHRVDPGTYYVSVAHFEPNNLASYVIHAVFSAVTDNYSDIWNTAGEDGWGIALNHQGDIIAGALYTYDLDGSNMWLLLNGAQKQADGSYLGPLVRYAGPVFSSAPWPSQSVLGTPVGTMRVMFTGASTAQLSYSVNGINVSKTISRFVYDKPPVCSFSIFDRSYATNFQDVWWNPSEPGWGMNIVHQGNNVAGALYTYDSSGKSLWLLLNGSQQQFTANSVIFSGDLLRFNGPAFNAAPWPATANHTKVGTMSLEFTEGNKGTLTYSVNGVQVVKQIERFVFSSPMTSCD